jgi:hypothetical protein
MDHGKRDRAKNPFDLETTDHGNAPSSVQYFINHELYGGILSPQFNQGKQNICPLTGSKNLEARCS